MREQILPTSTQGIRGWAQRWKHWWVRHFGQWCPGAPEMGHDPHKTRYLSVDHIIPLSACDDPFDSANLRILCQEFNAAKGGEIYRGAQLEAARSTSLVVFLAKFHGKMGCRRKKCRRGLTTAQWLTVQRQA